MSWTEAINSLKGRRIGGEPIAESVFVRAIAWLEARQQSDPTPEPTCIIANAEDGLCIDFRNGWDRELLFAAEFNGDGTAELETWKDGEIVSTEAIP